MLPCRALLALALALPLSACVNLQPISQYAQSAAELTGATDAARRWRDSEKHLLAHRLDGDVCPLGRSNRLPQARFDEAFEQVARIHGTVSDYYATLAALAADDLPRTQATGAALLKTVEAGGITLTSQEAKAVSALHALVQRALDGYRQREVKRLVADSHEDVTVVLGLLKKLAGVYAEELRSERTQLVNFVRCEIGQGDLSDKYLGRREVQRVQAHYDAELVRLTTYQAALDTLVQDHTRLRDALDTDAKAMTRLISALARSVRDLDRARDALAAL